MTLDPVGDSVLDNIALESCSCPTYAMNFTLYPGSSSTVHTSHCPCLIAGRKKETLFYLFVTTDVSQSIYKVERRMLPGKDSYFIFWKEEKPKGYRDSIGKSVSKEL
jgi:hypothetical protein